MRKIKILVANSPEEITGVTWWRMYRPLAFMAHRYPNLDIRWNQGRLLPSDFVGVDIVVAFRPSNPDHPNILATAKSWGCKILLDYDDDLLNIPTGSPFFNQFFGGADCINNCIALADEVWTSTQALSDMYKIANRDFLSRLRRENPSADLILNPPNFLVVPNAVLLSDLPDRANGNTKMAVWRGSHYHKDDLDLYRGQYDQILRNVNAFQWVGFMPTWAERDNKGVSLKIWVATMQWLDYLRALRPSIVWKPLVNNKFNQGKSNIAWLEATCAGAICLTNFAGKTQWEHATGEIPKFDEYYTHLWQKSAEAVRTHYDLEKWNEVRYQQLKKLAHGEETNPIPIPSDNGSAAHATATA